MIGAWRFDIAMLMMWVLGVDNVYVSELVATNNSYIVIDSLNVGE